MERGMTADQVFAAIWRRKLLVGAILGTVLVVGGAIVALRPSLYEASVVVRVEPQRPSEELVQRTVTELIEQRILTVRAELLARPVLQKAIEELGLYPELVKDKGIEAAVAQMRKDLTVKIEGENAFELTYQARDPQVAAKVANRLPQIFSQETLKLRQAQATRATELFSSEVDSLKTALTSWEQKIAEFKIAHIGELPEQLEMNMRGLERVGALLQTKSEELRAAETRRSELVRARAGGDTEAGRLGAAEDAMTRSLVAAQTTWTKDHPEVQRINKELGDLQQRRKSAEGRMQAERSERARATALVAQVEGAIEALRKQAETFQKRLDVTPKWTHELGVLNRDYEITKTKYQSVISRKVEAEIAQQMEARSAESMFNVISPAGVPVSPSKPDRMTGLLIVLLLGLGLSTLTAVVLEMRDDSIRDTSELHERLPFPVLAVVPNLGTMKTEKRVLAPVAARTVN
jgi:succinoglycan biosynthesis transport protein ExoP